MSICLIHRHRCTQTHSEALKDRSAQNDRHTVIRPSLKCVQTHPTITSSRQQLRISSLSHSTTAVHGDASREHSIYIHYSPVNCLDFSDWIYPLTSTGSSPCFPQSHGRSQCLPSAQRVDSCVSVCLLCMLNGAKSCVAVVRLLGFLKRSHVIG